MATDVGENGTVWLVGASGMLGTSVATVLQETGLNVIKTGHEVSITDFETLKAFSLSQGRIDFIINTAAYTAVDKAEDESKLCYDINVTGTANLALLAKTLAVPLLHISSDYVFSMKTQKSITEDTAKSPMGVYGKSKAQSEDAITKNLNKYYILRTSWLYGKHGKNFVDTMLNLMNTKAMIKVVNDQHGTPTACTTLSSVIQKIVQRYFAKNAIEYGIYNVTDLGETTWHLFAQKIYEIAKIKGLVTNECEVEPCTTEEFNAKAPRPKFSVLDKTKIQKALGISLPQWEDSLSQYLEEKILDK